MEKRHKRSVRPGDIIGYFGSRQWWYVYDYKTCIALRSDSRVEMEDDFKEIRKYKPNIKLEELIKQLEINAKKGKAGKYTLQSGKTPCFDWIDDNE
jgi:hypothetical protein